MSLYARDNIPANEIEARLQSCFNQEERTLNKDSAIRTVHKTALKDLLDSSTGKLFDASQTILRRYFDTVCIEMYSLENDDLERPDSGMSGWGNRQKENIKEMNLIVNQLPKLYIQQFEYEFKVYDILRKFVGSIRNSSGIDNYNPLTVMLTKLLENRRAVRHIRQATRNAIREFFTPVNFTRVYEKFRAGYAIDYINASLHVDGGNIGMFFESMINDTSPIINPIVQSKLEKQSVSLMLSQFSKPATKETNIANLPSVLTRKINSYLGGRKRTKRLRKSKSKRVKRKLSNRRTNRKK